MDVLSAYAGQLQQTISEHKKLRSLLTEKVQINQLALDHSVENNLSRLRQIDLEIDIIKTNQEIETITKIIDEKEKYFKIQCEGFAKDLKEADEKWDSLIAEAKSSKNPKVEPFLKAIEGIDINADLDKKVFVYKRLKFLM